MRWARALPGAETWVDRTSYRLQAEIGAPPDALALNGQGWGIPPPDPLAMQNDRLQGFIRLIRANMRYYGALRLDHVMSLFRLWWVPAHTSPLEGAYVHYPLHQLLTVLALESVRNHCLVVGEDLGVVPDEMRAAMPQFGIYHYKVMLFEKNGAVFRAPGEFVRRALATVTTHDMPTLRGYWEGRDIELRTRLHLYPSEPKCGPKSARERDEDRAHCSPRCAPRGSQPERPASAARAVHRRTRAGDAPLSRAFERRARGAANRGSARHGGSGQRARYEQRVSELAAQALGRHRGHRGARGSRRGARRDRSRKGLAQTARCRNTRSSQRSNLRPTSRKCATARIPISRASRSMRRWRHRRRDHHVLAELAAIGSSARTSALPTPRPRRSARTWTLCSTVWR
jgi:hypothetical protein